MQLPRALRLLEDAVAAKVTPGAQLSIRAPSLRLDLCVGRLAYAQGSPEVSVNTPYDLASLTKPLTALAWMHAGTDLATELDEVLPWMRGLPAAGATLEDLLTHRAQLASWKPFYQGISGCEAGSPEACARIVNAVTMTPLEPSRRARYSDLGYILAGEALREVTGEGLDGVIKRTVLEPLGLSNDLRFRGVGPAFTDLAIAPTELCSWREKLLQGEVHDDNAFAMGGVAGHAGIFGTARSLGSLGAVMLAALRGRDLGISPLTARAMLAPRPDGSHRLGWDTRSPEGSSAGSLMGRHSFGHLGFTGASLWCDPDAELAVALVTNRVHPRRDNPLIRALRPALHDAVIQDLRGR